MKENLNQTQRKKLQTKLTKTLNNHIKNLPKDFQQLLIDDLITALQNRITVLSRIHAKHTKNP